MPVSCAARGELVPVEAEVDEKKRSQGEGNHADGCEGVAKMAPVAGPEIEHAAGNERKCDGVGTGHPLAMLCNLTVTRSDEGGGGANHPGNGLHGRSRQTWAAGCKSYPCERTDKDGYDVGKAEDAMELEMTLADSRGEIDGADQESEDSGECMRDEEMAVGNDLQTVGVVHGVIGDKKNF